MGIQVNDSATIIGGVEYRSTGSSRGSSGIPVDLLPDNVVIHQPAPPAEDYSETLVQELGDVVEGELRIMELELRNGDQLEFAEGLFLRVEGDLMMRNGSVIDVRGNCSLVIEGDLTIKGGQIRVEEGAELTVHVGGDLDLMDAKVIEPEGSEDTWVPNIDRVSFVTAAFRENIPCWRIRGSTLFKGELYAPSAEVVIEQRAVVIGRVAAQRIRMSGCARMLYDPTLDNRNGYTAADQRLYQQDGQVLKQVRELDSLAPEELIKASLKIGVTVTAGDLTARVSALSVSEDEVADRHGWWSGFAQAKERNRGRRERWISYFKQLKRNSSMTIRGIGMNAHQFRGQR
jgi:cytoskeletal protein CcmA (bactofilin family)